MIDIFENFINNTLKDYFDNIFEYLDEEYIIKEYIKAGHNVNIENKFKLSLLYEAFDNCYLKTAKLLIKAGADVNFRGYYQNILTTAIGCHDYNIIKMLFKYGAYVENEPQGLLEFTEIEYALYSCITNDIETLKIIEILKKHEAIIEDENFFLEKLYKKFDFNDQNVLNIIKNIFDEEKINIFLRYQNLKKFNI